MNRSSRDHAPAIGSALEHPAIANLRTCQRQLDADGCMVGVSRQALDETLDVLDDLLAALKRVQQYLGFPEIARDVGSITVDRVNAAIAKALPVPPRDMPDAGHISREESHD